MKSRSIIPLRFAAVLLLGFIHSLALAGGDKGHAGDIRLLGRAEIESVIKTQLKSELKKSIRSLLDSNLSDADSIRIREILNRVGVEEYLKDIEKSPYQIQEKCTDITGQERDATANPNDRNGAICWSALHIASAPRNAYFFDLVSIAFHEHLHHFDSLGGPNEFRDLGHQIVLSFKKSMENIDQNKKGNRVYIQSDQMPLSYYLNFLQPILEYKNWIPQLIRDQSDVLAPRNDDLWISFHHSVSHKSCAFRWITRTGGVGAWRKPYEDDYDVRMTPVFKQREAFALLKRNEYSVQWSDKLLRNQLKCAEVYLDFFKSEIPAAPSP